MESSGNIIGRVEQLVESDLSCDEVLRETVRILKQEYGHFDWVGIYLLSGDTLELHNYLGIPTEHTEIKVGKGVCGTAVALSENQVIGDVTALDNYLACSLETRSEIVVLIRRGAEIFGQIDIDSDRLNAFTQEDELLLDGVADFLSRRF